MLNVHVSIFADLIGMLKEGDRNAVERKEDATSNPLTSLSSSLRGEIEPWTSVAGHTGAGENGPDADQEKTHLGLE